MHSTTYSVNLNSEINAQILFNSLYFTYVLFSDNPAVDMEFANDQSSLSSKQENCSGNTVADFDGISPKRVCTSSDASSEMLTADDDQCSGPSAHCHDSAVETQLYGDAAKPDVSRHRQASTGDSSTAVDDTDNSAPVSCRRSLRREFSTCSVIQCFNFAVFLIV